MLKSVHVVFSERYSTVHGMHYTRSKDEVRTSYCSTGCGEMYDHLLHPLSHASRPLVPSHSYGTVPTSSACRPPIMSPPTVRPSCRPP
jgi:hypothetical protein